MVAFWGNATATATASVGLDRLSEVPFYHISSPSALGFIGDKNLSLALPVVTYWVVSLFYCLLDALKLPFTEKYRLHEAEEITKRNRVSKRRVVVMVLLQQLIQTLLGILVMQDDEQDEIINHKANILQLSQTLRNYTADGVAAQLLFGSQDAHKAGWWLYWWGIPIVQFSFSFFVMDAWQYALHRLFHESRWLYRNFHSHHHRLYVPFAFGALYNHPLEGLLLDSAGGLISHIASFMTVRQGILLFSFSTLKTVCDHGGYAFPWYIDPLHLFFPNNAEYHDVHHQMTGLKFNYSQPYFVHFDVLFGTRISAEKFRKMRQVAAEAKKPASKEKKLQAVETMS